MIFRFFTTNLLVFLLVEFSLMQACAQVSLVRGEAGMEKVELSLKEEQITKVSGTDLSIEVKGVVDFTSKGCLGGPVGCPDHVQLVVNQAQESKEITLYFAHTVVQREQGINQASIFGYRIALIALRDKQVTLSIERSK